MEWAGRRLVRAPGLGAHPVVVVGGDQNWELQERCRRPRLTGLVRVTPDPGPVAGPG
jgi:hypothetical protein